MSEESSFKVGDRVIARGVVKSTGSKFSNIVFDGAGEERWAMRNSVLQYDNPIIFDPNDPRAKALIGKKVEAFDHFNFDEKILGTLESISTSLPFPFSVGGVLFNFIRAIPEKPTKKMTVAEVCDALGYTVEIVK